MRKKTKKKNYYVKINLHPVLFLVLFIFKLRILQGLFRPEQRYQKTPAFSNIELGNWSSLGHY